MTEAFPMIGGDGSKSYAKNSTIQRASSDAVKGMIDDAIANSFDVSKFVSANKTIKIADFGCSVGPNTFFAMKNVLDSIDKKCRQVSEDVEYQVFFNDHSSNDFNTLFTSLLPDRKYYVTGVPGSFYDRLFPTSSVHFMYSSCSLNWISKIPRELVDQNSPAWNKGRIHYGSASDEVANAYAAQFAKDMEMFLNARAKEMVTGGMMVLIMPNLPDGVHRSEIPIIAGVTYLLTSILTDMVNSGTIREAQLDSFNLPLYFPTVKEIAEVVRKNGCFRITTTSEIKIPNVHIPMEGFLMHFRSATEQVFVKHFGQELVEVLFERARKNISEISRVTARQLFVVLKRN